MFSSVITVANQIYTWVTLYFYLDRYFIDRYLIVKFYQIFLRICEVFVSEFHLNVFLAIYWFNEVGISDLWMYIRQSNHTPLTCVYY